MSKPDNMDDPQVKIRRKVIMRVHHLTKMLFVALLGFPVAAQAGALEPVYLYSLQNAKGIDAVSWPYCRLKSPGPGMTFTEGVPIRALADALDLGGYTTEGWNQASEVRFYVDGKLKSTQSTTRGKIDWFEAMLTDVPVGTHILTVQSTNKGGVKDGFPVPIVVTPMPQHARTVTLSADLMLSGAQDLDWQDATIIGKGFKVRSAPDWKGKVTIRNCFITGLGALTTAGIDVTSGGGAVTIEESIFEGTGALFVKTSGAAPIAIRHNEFRASNLIEFVPSNPGKSPVVTASSPGSGTKVFQGNRIGAGIVHFDGPNWLVGGDTTSDSNILIGPRCVIEMNGPDGIVRGNFMHHDYHGGWSQGFNLYCENSPGLLAEHNVIRGSSWVVQSFTGELRYNLIVDCGHNWIRALLSGARAHHNIFINATGSIPNGSTNSGIWVYNKQTGVEIYNNTCDPAGKIMGFGSPMIEISAGCAAASIRNNIFYGFVPGGRMAAVVQRGLGDKDTDPRVGYADYNCFFNPDASQLAGYADGLVAGKKLGDSGFGGHDVKADPQFAKGNPLPYPINEADVWNGKFTVAQVLTLYREHYAPKPGSPVLGAGDPADGKDSYIGAIGPGGDAPGDRFGRWAVSENKK